MAPLKPFPPAEAVEKMLAFLDLYSLAERHDILDGVHAKLYRGLSGPEAEQAGRAEYARVTASGDLVNQFVTERCMLGVRDQHSRGVLELADLP
jgi:hypothetical protein